MTLAFAISMYLVIWWIVLFAILPIGVHTQSDDGNITPGTAESAPLFERVVGDLMRDLGAPAAQPA